MKTKLFFLLLAMVLATAAGGQSTQGVAGNLRFGLAQLPNAANALQLLLPAGEKGFHATFYGYGAEGYYRSNSLLLALDGFLGTQNERSWNNQLARAYAGGLHARWGVILQEGKQYWIYPSFGLGGDVLALCLHTDPHQENETRLSYRVYNPVLDVGLNSDFVAARKTEELPLFGGQMIGIRAGFRFSPNQQRWLATDWETTAALPPYTHRVVYLSVSVGYGVFVSK